MSGVGMNFMTVSTMLSSSSSSPQPVGTAFFGRVRLPSEACSIAAAASASFSSFFLMPYYTEKANENRQDGIYFSIGWLFKILVFDILLKIIYLIHYKKKHNFCINCNNCKGKYTFTFLLRFRTNNSDHWHFFPLCMKLELGGNYFSLV